MNGLVTGHAQQLTRVGPTHLHRGGRVGEGDLAVPLHHPHRTGEALEHLHGELVKRHIEAFSSRHTQRQRKTISVTSTRFGDVPRTLRACNRSSRSAVFGLMRESPVPVRALTGGKHVSGR
jgi:hypothetical protein